MNLQDISMKLQAGKAKDVKVLVQQAIDEGIPAQTILEEGLLSGMSVIGEKFKNNEVFVPEVLVAARAMNMGANLLKPLLAEAGVKASGKVCIGTVKGDLHDIGKNLVGMMLEGSGFTVMDLGVDVKPEMFIDAVRGGAKIIGMSALLTTTMPMMAKVIERLKDEGLRDQVKVMIGGAPITQEYADEIGADGYSSDAASAAELAKRLIA